MKRRKLLSETNTPEVMTEVEELIFGSDETMDHKNCNPFFEHGQWFVTCSDCGASWSVVDVNDGLGFERLDNGDDSCFEQE